MTSLDLSRMAQLEFTDMMFGDKIGEGSFRQVYEFRWDESLVIKIDRGEGGFQNVTEWTTWENVCHTKWAKWFAPCVKISNNGIFLIQKRVTPLVDQPKRIPSFFDDVAWRNWGTYKDHPVAVDYAWTELQKQGLKRARMIKPGTRLHPRKQWSST